MLRGWIRTLPHLNRFKEGFEKAIFLARRPPASSEWLDHLDVAAHGIQQRIDQPSAIGRHRESGIAHIESQTGGQQYLAERGGIIAVNLDRGLRRGQPVS